MRQAYAMIPEYDPYGEKTNALMRDGQAAYVAKDCKTALEKFRTAIALDFILSDAHALSADCLEQAGDKEGEKREEAIAQGLFDSIIISGDGEKPETAFHIVTMHEEERDLAVAGRERHGARIAHHRLRAGGQDQRHRCQDRQERRGVFQSQRRHDRHRGSEEKSKAAPAPKP